MADSYKINEAILRQLGVDLATIRALRKIQSLTVNSSLSVEDAVFMLTGVERKQEIPTQIPDNYAFQINELKREINDLRSLIVQSRPDLREKVNELETLKWLSPQ